jgi:(1->4)-alpha-D-glucan 1-alpha-D-glucosylmutase
MTTSPRFPSSLYRLQLSSKMPLARLRGLLPYLDALGVGGIYLSPILRARSGSSHGYDGVDPGELWPELGSEAEWRSVVESAHARRMAVVVDIVPNHAATSEENPGWWELLRQGPEAPAARRFDVDWDSEDPPAIVLPVLSHPLRTSLADGSLWLREEPEGIVVATSDGRKFPLAPETEREAREILSEGAALGPVNTDRIHRLLERQHYRLVPRSEANRRINYRRFFQVNDLIGQRVEDPMVFDLLHHRIIDWATRGLIDGVRVDHIDGLYEPRQYLERLCTSLRNGAGAPVAIWVEKILARNEQLRTDWPVEGTTGYDSLSRLTWLFVDETSLGDLDRLGATYAPDAMDFERIVDDSKRRALEQMFVADLNRLTRAFCRHPPATEDGGNEGRLPAALSELCIALDLYRTYAEGEMAIDEVDRSAWFRAFERARRHGRGADELRPWFTSDAKSIDGSRKPLLRWQQFTAAVMAKGLEDRALYRECRLSALNEVGTSPRKETDRDVVTDFHAHFDHLARRWPATMVTTSTHDTKRSEDVRSRLLALSQHPTHWGRLAAAWRDAVARRTRDPGLTAPEASAFYLLFQSVVGTWPLDGICTAEYRARLRAYGVKALREAGEATDWETPHLDWEGSILDRVDDIVAHDAPFRSAMAATMAIWGFGGALLSLVQLTLKLTVPGVPDVYQGCELWDDSLVDPDNRRPIDWELRESQLRRLGPWIDAVEPPLGDLLSHWADGRVKLFLTARLLRRRRLEPDLWRGGEYHPLRPEGDRASVVVAFARRHSDRWAIVVAARHLLEALGPTRRGPPWQPPSDLGTLRLPGDVNHWIDAISGRRWSVGTDRGVPVAGVIDAFPSAVLVPAGDPTRRISGPAASGSSPRGSRGGSEGTFDPRGR